MVDDGWIWLFRSSMNGSWVKVWATSELSRYEDEQRYKK
jgi:hypothetical protein